MGYYINPKNENGVVTEKAKLQFLMTHGTVITKEEFMGLEFDPDRMCVITLNNNEFLACAICYSERELAYFKDMSRTDTRIVGLNMVDREHLEEFLKY